MKSSFEFLYTCSDHKDSLLNMADPTQERSDRIQFSISSDLKERAKRSGNASAYMRESIRRRLDRYQKARRTLERRGWQKDEIRAVIDVLNGVFIEVSPDHTYSDLIGIELQDAEDNPHMNLPAKWGLERWDWMKESVQEYDVGRALWVVSEEFWSTSSAHVDL